MSVWVGIHVSACGYRLWDGMCLLLCLCVSVRIKCAQWCRSLHVCIAPGACGCECRFVSVHMCVSVYMEVFMTLWMLLCSWGAHSWDLCALLHELLYGFVDLQAYAMCLCVSGVSVQGVGGKCCACW